MASPRLFVLSGPTAVGKNVVFESVKKLDPSITRVVTMTTRPARVGEQDGVTYRFVTREEFLRQINCGNMAEWVEFEGNLYGTPIDMLGAKADMVAILDTVGAKKVKKMLGGRVVTIFLMPPSKAALLERMSGRAKYPGEDMSSRVRRAEADMAQSGSFDHVLVNDDLGKTVADFLEIVRGK